MTTCKWRMRKKPISSFSATNVDHLYFSKCPFEVEITAPSPRSPAWSPILANFQACLWGSISWTPSFYFFSKLSVAWLHQPSRMVLNSLNIYMFYSWRLRIDCSPLTFGFKKSRPVVAFTFSNPGTVNIVSMIQNGRQGSPVCHPIRTYSWHVSRLFLVLLISIWVCLKIGYIHVYSQL